MPEPRKGLFQDWSRWDTAGLIAVAGIFCPPLGLSILIAVGVNELWKIVVSGIAVARESCCDLVRGIAKSRRDLAWTVRNWFTFASTASSKSPETPSPEQLSATALQHYERTLRMIERSKLDEIEQAAARAQAKQQYLRKLDQAMQ